MTRDLIARAAAAQAAADADRPERCHWCGATDDVAQLVTSSYEDAGTVLECFSESECRVRFEIGIVADPPSTTPEAPQAPGTAPHAPESSTTNPEGT
jgi:hypothetical protein